MTILKNLEEPVFEPIRIELAWRSDSSLAYLDLLEPRAKRRLLGLTHAEKEAKAKRRAKAKAARKQRRAQK